ncbi:MAG: tetratricopeptide repeat protein [Proteobacteria bacterium]|nr:tetratricopeptide repeat protein [Pseudomonadota bacterium]
MKQLASPGLTAFALLTCVATAASGSPVPAAPVGGAGASSLVRQMLTPPTPEQVQVLEEERAQDLELYIRRSADFREVIDSTVRSVYEMRKVAIEAKYRERIEKEDDLELESLRDAIEYFEAFLKKYPDEEPYTPDAMFRLAELYYDVSYIEFLERLAKYGEAQEAGTLGDEEPPMKEFDRTIALFRDLIRRYPDYANVDGAYYLLGYCLNDTGKEEEARLAWLNLVCENKYTYDPVAFEEAKGKGGPERPARVSAGLDTGVPEATIDVGFVNPFEGCTPIRGNSRFFFESWWLIGNYHFDYDSSRYGVETAIAAYKKLVEDPKHKFYDKGLYKLAWSYFKADRYPEAIAAFAQVVDFSDEQESKSSGMRPEAIQYLAVCFFTDDWNVDQMPDPVSGIERLGDPKLMPQDRKWTREVYARLGDIYSENEKHEEAIAVWKLFLEKWPLDVQAPFVQDRIADAYREMRRFDEELAERSKLDKYGKGSEWWTSNEDHPEAQNQVATMSEDALIGAAVAHHQNAQALRAKGQATGDEQILGFALEEYNLAAAAYRKYIEQNPDTPDAYDLNFQLADALFWSGQYDAAKAEYVKVRDSNLDDRYREQSAHMVILCVERTIENEAAAGRFSLREKPPELAGEPPAPQQIDMPPLLLELMAERENYLKYNPGAPQTSTFEYQSAQNYYRYGYWDEAKKRYEAAYVKYCKKDEISLESWKVLLNMAVDQQNLDEKERLALLEQQQQCAVEGAKLSDDESIDLGSLLGDVAMQRAMDKFKECNDGKDATVCTEAGDQLVAAVAKAPKHQSADAALHNAALAYENAQRFETAMQLYERIVNEYPESQWVDKCLFKQAFAANAFFEYEKALANYKILADSPKFKGSQYREDSVYNSAYILTNLQSYNQAIPYWQRYSNEVADETKRVEAAFNAADMPFRAGSWGAAVKSYEAFVGKYERNTTAGPFVVKAAYRLAEAEGNRNKKKSQIKAWQRTVELYKRLVNQPGSMSAEYAAHANFLIIEEDMRVFEKFEIKGNQKQIAAKQVEGAEKVKEFEARYREIADYRRPEWSLAAEFRIGYAYEVYAKAYLNTPMPTLDDMLKMAGMSKAEIKYIKSMPADEREDMQYQIEDKIRAKLEETVSAMEEKAQAEYKIAIDLARKGNISNEWTLLALERMNAYDPDNYPRQHNGIVEGGSDVVAVPPWAGEVD